VFLHKDCGGLVLNKTILIVVKNYITNTRAYTFLAVCLFFYTAWVSGCAKERDVFVSPQTFIPFPTNALACSVSFTKNWGEVEVVIKNASSTKQVFSAPRSITGVDFESVESETNMQINTLEFNFRWGENGFAEAQYMTLERKSIVNRTISLRPKETFTIVLNLTNTCLGRRDNVVPFNGMFTKGDSDIIIRASLVSIMHARYAIIAQSNEERFKGKYIY
jgi:hypothetical protein